MSQLERPPEDWQVPPSAYLVAAPARSGSTLLAHILRRTHMLGRPKEFFNRSWMQQMLGGELPSATACFRYASENGRTHNGCLGIKFIGTQLQFAANTSAFEEWLPQRNWIRLRRRDVIGQAVSHAIAKQTGAWSSLKEGKSEPTYQFEQILESLEIAFQEDAFLSVYFALHNENVVELVYEDFQDNHQNAVDTVCKYFKLRVPDISKRPPPGVKRQRTHINQEWRERFLDEIGQHTDIEAVRVTFAKRAQDSLEAAAEPSAHNPVGSLRPLRQER